MKCSACIDEDLISELYYEFKQTDIKFCSDMLSSEETDSIKWGIIDKVETFCDKHKSEFYECDC
jgi:hypothetical protein